MPRTSKASSLGKQRRQVARNTESEADRAVKPTTAKRRTRATVNKGTETVKKSAAARKRPAR